MSFCIAIGQDPLVDEPPNGLLHLALLGGQREIHRR